MAVSGTRSAPALRGFAVAAVALAGLAFTLTPLASRLDDALLDVQWSMLHRFDPRPAPPDIVIVGIDDRTAASIAAPPGLWHESLGMALVRIASARPRAIGIDLPLPERSYDGVRAGLDRALLVGLAAAAQNGPLVASLSIDARTRVARPVHLPFLAVLGEEGLGLGLLARDGDGVVRRFSLAVPTEDGAFPTLAGRLCRALSKGCAEGLVNFALGEPFAYVPLQRVLELRDTDRLAQLFGGRVVLLGDVQAFVSRVAVPLNFAGWERGARDSPAVIVHAQALRTALLQKAPREAARPWTVVLVSLAALLVLMRDWRQALLTGGLAAGALVLAAVLALRGGVFVSMAAPLATVLLGVAALALHALLRRFEVRRRG